MTRKRRPGRMVWISSATVTRTDTSGNKVFSRIGNGTYRKADHLDTTKKEYLEKAKKIWKSDKPPQK